MNESKVLQFIGKVLDDMPEDWLKLTTHRLDIYNEGLAKTEFLEHLEVLFRDDVTRQEALSELPTAFDYIRLGHPLSCILEWVIAKLSGIKPENVISFSSKMMPILAILRKNALIGKRTKIYYSGALPKSFDVGLLQQIYGYEFEIEEIDNSSNVSNFEGSKIFISNRNDLNQVDLLSKIDFYVQLYGDLGSVILVNGEQNEFYSSEIQHVRRRESIAMTPANCDVMLKALVAKGEIITSGSGNQSSKVLVEGLIREITDANTKAVIGSSGLSIQYAIMMGLIHDAYDNHEGKAIKFIVPTNCYGGTNDQARRVAASINNVEVLDLTVDGGRDMVKCIDTILEEVAYNDAIPYIIAEIPTNPRVEVPDLFQLRDVLGKVRLTASGETAIDPVFVLDQTFCPNVHFLGSGKMLSTVRTISYVSGSKFPSGGLCTAGYCIGNELTTPLIERIEAHLKLCDNEATALQYDILANQMPSMKDRIYKAYRNTREFVDHIAKALPEAKINFVSEELANQEFTPSVFSLDLPTKGDNEEERESYKRALNHRLINLMISEIPDESKYCVSYGQLKGSYWTIPATSTQGTTKEGDKDYIARVAISPNLDMERHKKVFSDFVSTI